MGEVNLLMTAAVMGGQGCSSLSTKPLTFFPQMGQQLISHQVHQYGQYTVQTEIFNPNTNAANNMTNSLKLKCKRSSIWVRKFKLTMTFKFWSTTEVAHIFTIGWSMSFAYFVHSVFRQTTEGKSSQMNGNKHFLNLFYF